MASGISVRKKGSKSEADADGTSETLPLNATTGSAKPRKLTDSVLVFAIVFLVVVLAYLVFAPADKMAAHQEAVNTQLEQLSSSLQEKKRSWAAKYDELSVKLSRERLKLANMTASVGFVPKDHHEEEVGKLLSHHEEEVGQLKSQHEEEVGKLQSQVSEKQANIEALEATIKKNEEELKKVKSKMDGMEEDVGLFCAECPFNAGGLRTSCGARKNYLMTRHKDSEEVATEAVMKMDPNCKKKAGR